MEEIRQYTYRVLRVLLSYFRQQEVRSTELEKDELWQRIEVEAHRAQQIRKRKQLYLYIAAAASVALLFGIGWLMHSNFEKTNSNRMADFASQNKVIIPAETDEIKLIFSEHEEMTVEDRSVVAYSPEGAVAVNADTVRQNNPKSETPKAKETNFNQIVIPKGRRAQLMLSDGSRLWVNAGTRVIYPQTFDEKRREIFVEGEVYLEVAHNEKVPFIVSSKDFSVQVLGTKFDVSTYETEPAAVVLVEGSVKVNNQTAKEEAILQPNQRILIQDGKLEQPKNVNVQKYISWINDLLICENEPLPNVLKKLGLYYGKEFVWEEGAKQILLSGKLELKEDLNKVLHTIAFSFPVFFEEQQVDTIRVQTRIEK